MALPDEFSSYVAELLQGSYDCVDRIALRAYFRLGQTSGGFLTWWNKLFPGKAPTQEYLRRMAGDFARRIKAFSQKHHIPLQYCEIGDKKKFEKAEKARPKDPNFQGIFLILVARAPAPVWEIKKSRRAKLLIRRARSWPLVNHYHFHIMDKQWGHLSIRMSAHPPFGAQILLNGHEWLERQARKKTICYSKEGNCFVGGSDLPALNRLAAELQGSAGLVRLAQVCDRWIYSACLCFGLTRQEQQRSEFRYSYSTYQLEYSRNLLFKSGRKLNQVYQGLIDRTRNLLDVPRLKTIFGRKHRPHQLRTKRTRLEKVLDRSVHNLTVFKLHFGRLTLKMYDKGERVLRIELIINNTEELRCGKGIEKLPGILERSQQMIVEFLAVVQAAHLSFLPAEQLDSLAMPTYRGQQRLAGVDIQKPRLRTVAKALLALAPQPGGFTAEQLAARVRSQEGRSMARYSTRKAAYDLRKFRGKKLVRRIANSRRYRVQQPGIRVLAALLILREEVLKPVLAGVCHPKRGRPPKNVHPLDRHYQTLQHHMLSTLQYLKLAA
jgi:hypothetical protein